MGIGMIVSPAAIEGSLPLRFGNDLYLSDPGEEREETCSTVYMFGTELRKFDEDVDVVYTEVEVDIDVDAEVDVEGRERSTVLVEESVSTTSTTAHVPLLLSVEEAEVPLDRRRS
jgi:hypothetical protein